MRVRSAFACVGVALGLHVYLWPGAEPILCQRYILTLYDCVHVFSGIYSLDIKELELSCGVIERG